MKKPWFARVCAGSSVRLVATATLTALLGVAVSHADAPWTPASLSNLALWLDANDLSASPVSAWNDKSGNGRHFAQATGANQPTYSATAFNGYPGVTFDGSDDFMSAGDTLDLGTQSLGIIAAVKYNTSNTSGMIISKTRYAGGSGRYCMGRFIGTSFTLGTGTPYQYVVSSDFAAAISPSADTSTTPRLLGFDLNRQTSGYIKNWIDGVAVKTSTITGNTTDYNSTDLLLLGAYGNPTGTGPQGSSYLSGVIAEMVVVRTAMTDVERWKLEGYLAWKWGLQDNLPADHPYKSAAPSADTTPPTIATLSPLDDATDVATYANLVATFSESIQKGTGNITLKKSADNSTVETFDVATSPRITVSGATLTIDPTSVLAVLTGYYVEIDATAVKDLSSNSFAGISGSTAWNFTTGVADITAPAIATLSPADNATRVAVDANLVATFDESVQKGTGNITLKKSADNSTVETFDVATSPRVTVSGATLTIAPTSVLAGLTGYYVEIDATAVKDLSSNSFAGISGSTAWNFTTGAAPAVANFSFEDPVLADGGTGAPTGWTFVGQGETGHANPVHANYAGATGGTLPSPALGNQCAYVASTSYAYRKQTTDETIEAGVTYTLTVAVGDRLNATPHESFLLRLGYGAATFLTAIADNQPAGSTLADGEFKDFSVSFTAQAGQPYIGQKLAILIGAQNNVASARITDFDNVRLTDSKSSATPGTLIYVQ